MNRLVIVGNGFDKAHGLPTSYYDFMLWYLKEACRMAEENTDGAYGDELIVVFRIQDKSAPNVQEFTSVEQFKRFIVDSKERHIYADHNDTFAHGYSIRLETEFSQRLMADCCNYNWVDIENLFYQSLCAIKSNSADTKGKVDYLNRQLEQLKGSLEYYLSTLPKPPKIHRYERILQSTAQLVRGDYPINKTLLLDFNYTSTTDLYLAPDRSVLHMHGKIKTPENRIIFGFGDELDDNYKLFKADESCNYVEHLKSFLYPFTDNYYELTKFMGSGRTENSNFFFEVVILGHSCGRSDRTLLNLIFQHPNCRSVRVYYHGSKEKNNFRIISNSIARHFDLVRWYGRILPYHRCESMPQFDEPDI